MTQVIKRGGRKQTFSPAKIKNSIKRAAKEARISPAKIERLVKEVGQPVIDLARTKKLIKAVNIRKSVLGRLDRRVKSIGSAWRRSEKKKKK